MYAYVEHFRAMPPPAPINPESTPEIAKRLKLLRKALGYSQAFMAQLAGVTPQAWGNYEQGLRRIDIDQALVLCRATGVTLPFIYQGNFGILPADLLGKIELELRDQSRKSTKRA